MGRNTATLSHLCPGWPHPEPWGHGWTWGFSPKAISVPITLPLWVFLGIGTNIPASFRVPSQLSGAGAPGDGTRSKKGLTIVEVPPPLPGRQISAEFGLLALPSLARNSPAVTLWPLFHPSSVRPAVTCPSEGVPGAPGFQRTKPTGLTLRSSCGRLQLPGWDFSTKQHKAARSEAKEQGQQDGHKKRRTG